MTPFFDRVRDDAATSTRRRLLRAMVGSAAAAVAGVAPRVSALAHAASEYCADTPEQEFLRLINDYRAANGRGTLSLGQRSGAAAQHHSADMANRNYLSHTTPGTGEGPRERMVAHGYPANTTWWGENIYAGYGVQNGVDLGSAQAAFTWWKNSPGHNANMLNANYRVIGIDRTSNPSSQYRNYWTTDFGGVVDQAATLCGAAPPPPSAPTTLTIVGHAQSPNANSGRYAYDGDPTTAWRSSNVTPSSAWVRFDLGSARALSEIRWQFSQTGSADQFTIQVSSDAASWQTLASRGNASASGTWQTLAATAAARYVRFNFANPNRDRRLGYLSEVQILGTTSTLRSAEITANGRSEDDARQAGPPAISSEDKRAAKPRGGKQSRKRRRGGKRGR